MNIKDCILRVYGFNLSDDELQKLITWYQKVGQYKSREKLHSEIQKFLLENFPNSKPGKLCEEDTSDMTVLLAALDNALKA